MDEMESCIKFNWAPPPRTTFPELKNSYKPFVLTEFGVIPSYHRDYLRKQAHLFNCDVVKLTRIQAYMLPLENVVAITRPLTTLLVVHVNPTEGRFSGVTTIRCTLRGAEHDLAKRRLRARALFVHVSEPIGDPRPEAIAFNVVEKTVEPRHTLRQHGRGIDIWCLRYRYYRINSQ